MEYQDTEQKRKIRIVSIATIIAVVVIGLGVWLVVGAISSTKKTDVATTDTATTEQKDTKKTESEQKGNPNATSPANQYNANEKSTTPATTATPTTPAVAAPAKSEVPTTGPAEDMLIVALLAGVATYLVFLNLNLKKQANSRA